MQIEKINCLVTLSEKGSESIITQVVKSGPSALSVAEIPLVQMQNGPDSVTRVHSAGFNETSNRVELSRLREIYPSKIIDLVYPGLNASLPKTIDDLDLAAQHLHDAPKIVAAPVMSKDDEIAALKAELVEARAGSASADVTHETKEGLRAALKEAGVDVPLGNHGIPALKAMMPKAA